MSEQPSTGIELSERQRERFEQVREECDEPGVPEPTDQQVVKGLLDTWDAVNDGHYSESEQIDELAAEVQEAIRDLRVQVRLIDDTASEADLRDIMWDLQDALPEGFEESTDGDDRLIADGSGEEPKASYECQNCGEVVQRSTSRDLFTGECPECFDGAWDTESRLTTFVRVEEDDDNRSVGTGTDRSGGGAGGE